MCHGANGMCMCVCVYGALQWLPHLLHFLESLCFVLSFACSSNFIPLSFPLLVYIFQIFFDRTDLIQMSYSNDENFFMRSYVNKQRYSSFAVLISFHGKIYVKLRIKTSDHSWKSLNFPLNMKLITCVQNQSVFSSNTILFQKNKWHFGTNQTFRFIDYLHLCKYKWTHFTDFFSTIPFAFLFILCHQDECIGCDECVVSGKIHPKCKTKSNNINLHSEWWIENDVIIKLI